MSTSFTAIKISDSVYWVGAIDWGVRNFHGYTTEHGTTYNAYLIMSDKPTLVDTVKKVFEAEMFARIASVIDPKEIEYIVSNHAEPDHSGSLAEAIELINPEKVFASAVGVQTLKKYYSLGIELSAVKTGDSLDLGNRTLQFIETKMIHWPDSMISHLKEEHLLFSQDAFGMHLASTERFDDELPWDLLQTQAADYYANIVTLYSPQVQKLLSLIAESQLKFEIVAPDHGPVWRTPKGIEKIVELYDRWSKRHVKNKIVIVYDTMWKSTEKMARAVEEGAKVHGAHVIVLPLTANDRSAVAKEMLDAAAIVVGTPTLNNNIFPSLADVLTYVKGLKFKTPVGAVFGSYGWSGEATKQAAEYLCSMGCEVLGEVKCAYAPNETVLKECVELGRKVAEKVKNDIMSLRGAPHSTG
jgi:flavorubredoxin